MIRRPPRSTLSSSSAASDVYKRQGINAEYGGTWTNMADMDELLASFSGISLNNRAAIVAQFSRVLQTDEQTASFFLESHQNDIARAVDAYLQLSAGNKVEALTAQNPSVVPSGIFENDASWDPKQYAPGTHIVLSRRIANNGTGRWPEGCEIVQADGNLGLDSIPVPPLSPSEVHTIHLHAQAPGQPGVFNAAFRLRSPLHGFCSEEIWLIFEVIAMEQASMQAPMQQQQQDLQGDFAAAALMQEQMWGGDVARAQAWDGSEHQQGPNGMEEDVPNEMEL
eukprot:TRINITY_DN3130_c0_g1_i1.p1 TRINITY_DN3130_c0_g1~~TRINITY_DN3130_c0_g1_i1.p1  ORF type:complete len:281 (+),score=59.97 TRINITY_DN3130_c0_g1_i1:139-981(+)